MAKIVLFSEVGYSGSSTEYRSNDPDLSLNGNDFVFKSALVISGDWQLFAEPGHKGEMISLEEAGGPDLDGVQKDYADWAGANEFHVMSVTHNQ